MAFIDADEFVFVRNNTYWDGHDLCGFMDGFMKAYPNAGALEINWLIFGSSHHEKRPAGGVLENFTMCSKNFRSNGFTKYICDPLKTLAAGVHMPVLRKGSCNLDENGDIVDNIPTDKFSFEKIRINHYFCKSLEEYTAIKMGRGDVTFGVTVKKIGMFHDHDQNEEIDTEILSRI